MVFDFDGVIADTEPLHYEAFARVLTGHARVPSREEYFRKYVGLNDRAFIRAVLNGTRVSEQQHAELLAAKNADYMTRIARGLPLLDGVAEFVQKARQRYPLAICSGARRVEIETILRGAALLDAFREIVSADDVTASKPDPAGFRMAIRRLGAHLPGLEASQCLAIEDSALGVAAARGAGMKVLHLRTCAAGATASADHTAANLLEVTLETVERLFRN